MNSAELKVDHVYRMYPGFKQTEVANEVDRHVENLNLLGYSVMENVMSTSQAAQIEETLHKLWKKQEDEFGKDFLLKAGEYGTHRGLLIEDQVFIDMAANSRVLAVINAIVGETAILNLQNASAAFPHTKHFQSAFHRDFAKDFVVSKPLSVNAFWCITDFSIENGCTQIIPHTHKMENFPSKEYIEQNIVHMKAKAGSVLFWDSLLLHRTGYNSTEKVRYGINHMYTRPFLKQQIDFPEFLKGRIDIESRLGQLFGFWTIPPKSVKEFRVAPNKRTYRVGQG